MTITQLQYVVAVAEHKNFTTAAEKCFVTQPTLSMQIQKLEEELDIKIFDRTKKPIQLTDVGQQMVLQAHKILNESDRMKDIIDQQKGFVGGDFKIGVIPTITPTLVPMFLNTFIKKYPKVNLIIEEYNTEEIIKCLKNGTIDAALAATPLEHPEIKEIVLYYEPFVGYFPINFRQNKSELLPEDIDLNQLLLLEDGHCFRNSILNLCSTKSIENNKHFEIKSGGFETLVKLSNEGLGVTLLPYLHSLELKEKDKENLLPFKEPKPSREVSLIFSKNELKRHIIDALVQTIKGIVKGAIAYEEVQIISPKLKI